MTGLGLAFAHRHATTNFQKSAEVGQRCLTGRPGGSANRSKHAVAPRRKRWASGPLISTVNRGINRGTPGSHATDHLPSYPLIANSALRIFSGSKYTAPDIMGRASSWVRKANLYSHDRDC